MKNKLLLIVFVFFTIALSGCVTAPKLTYQQQIDINENIPMCFSEKECEAKWADARKWISNNCATKIQIYSDNLIETYNPPEHSPSLAARIIKEPAGNNSYAIIASIWCNNMFGCVPSKYEALMDFNDCVNSTVYNNPNSFIEVLAQSNYSKPLMGFNCVEFNGNVIVKNVNYGSPC